MSKTANIEIPVESDTAALLSIQIVGKLCACSTRHVRRLVDRGAMPRPLNLGRLIRWRRSDIDAWIKSGCPDLRKGNGDG